LVFEHGHAADKSNEIVVNVLKGFERA